MLLTFLYPVFFLLFGIFSWRRPDWGIYSIIFALPAYLMRFEVFSVPFTVLEGMVLILFVTWLAKKLITTTGSLRGDSNRRSNPVGSIKDYFASLAMTREIAIPILLFLLAATVSVFVAPQLRDAAGVWKAYFVEPLLFFIVFVNVINTKEKLRNVFWVLGLSLVVPSLLAIYQKITGNLIPLEFWSASATRRVTSVYGYPNAIGLYFAPIVTIFIGWLVSFFQDKNYRNFFMAGVVVVLGGLSIVFAVSKGAALAVAIGILFYLLFWPGLRKWFAGILIIGIGLTFLVAPQLLSTEGQKTVPGGGSLEIRIEQWQEGLQMLSIRPLLGAGLSGYQQRVAPFHEKDYIEIFMYPHQIILNFWTEIGLLGLIAFIWLVVLFYKRGFSGHFGAKRSGVIEFRDPIGLSAPRMIFPIMGGMTTLLIHGLVDVPYFKNDLSMLFWIILSVMVVIHTKRKFLFIENN